MNQGCKYIIIASYISVSLLVLRTDSNRNLFTFVLTYHTILGIQATDITTFDCMNYFKTYTTRNNTNNGHHLSSNKLVT